MITVRITSIQRKKYFNIIDGTTAIDIVYVIYKSTAMYETI